MQTIQGYFFSFFKKYLIATFFMILVGGGIGYFLSKPPRQAGDVANVDSRFGAVVTNIEKSNYRKLLEIFRAPTDATLTESIGKHGMVLEGVEWGQTPLYLFGNKYLESLVKDSPNPMPDIVQGKKTDEQVAFPDINYIGVTMNPNGNRCVTTFNVSGRMEVWLWKRSKNSWTTASLPTGFGLKNTAITRDKISFTLFPLGNATMIRDYEFDLSGSKELERFKTEL